MNTWFKFVCGITLALTGPAFNLPAQPWSVSTAPAVTPQPNPIISNAALPPGVLAFNSETQEFTAEPGVLTASFTFWVTNVSSGEVVLQYIQTSCGCTAPKIQLPATLPAGQALEIPVTMDLRGRSGVNIKTVTLYTDKGQKPLQVKAIMLAGEQVMSAADRLRNQQIAMVDRQAVFKGDCARCHLEPLIGKTGKDLYVAACGICHDAKDRAPIVTNLRQLKVNPTEEYWRFYTAHGKPATMMPGFAQPQGPLSQPQIDSLVAYLQQEFGPKVPPLIAPK